MEHLQGAKLDYKKGILYLLDYAPGVKKNIIKGFLFMSNYLVNCFEISVAILGSPC